MGWGDEIMAAGRARMAQETDPRPVAIVTKGGRPRWHEAWLNNPRIWVPGSNASHQSIVDGPGARPYVDTSNKQRWRFIAWQQTRGELYLSDEERAQAGDYVVIQPHVKTGAHNKDWGWPRWQRLADLLKKHARLVQVGSGEWRGLNGVERITTNTFRKAAGIIAGARLVVVPEGAMHHAAAALRVPAVVLYGSWITPDITGYPEQAAIVAGKGPCGARDKCSHCSANWASITPEHVAGIVLAKLRDEGESRTAAA